MTNPGGFDPDLVSAFGVAYELQRELTGGGMSRVFVAIERALNREIVIKVLPPELAAGVNRDRFRREIQVAAQLQHPHIVPLHSAGEHGDILYYTMPFIQGESLKHALHGGERFSPRDVMRILHDVGDALAYAHERGVVHRDIKPANVLRSGAHAVVTDFGVAKAISAALPAVGMTTSGMAIGTPAYMAPEQLAGDPAADHRMDIYAVGLLAYELLTGEMPFVGPSPQATMAAQFTRDPVPVVQRRGDVPEALSALVTKCLAKEPANRPQSARELCAALDEITMPSGDYVPRARPRRRWPLAVGGGIIALLAAGAVWAVRQNAPRPSVPATAATPTPAPPAITHADSVEIAEALERRAKKPAAGAPAASTKAPGVARADPGAVGRAKGRGANAAPTRPAFVTPFVDSVARVALVLTAERASDQFQRPAPNPLSSAAFAERAANLGPARGVLIAPLALPSASSAVDSAGRLVAERLRRELAAPAAAARYSVVENPSARGPAPGDQRGLDALTRASGAEIVVSLIPEAGRDGVTSWTIIAHDLTATDAYATRSVRRRFTRDSIAADLDALAQGTRRLLDQMDHAPRANAGDPATRAFDERAANLGPPRRLVIANHAPDQNPAVQEAGSTIMDVLRHALASSTRFVPVNRDSTVAMLEKTRDIKALLAALNADAIATIHGVVGPPDSVTWILTVSDMGATHAYAQRTISVPRAPLAAPLPAVARLIAQALEAFDLLDHAPRAAAKP